MPRKSRFDAAEVARMTEHRERGMTLPQIAMLHDCNHTTVLYWTDKRFRDFKRQEMRERMARRRAAG